MSQPIYCIVCEARIAVRPRGRRVEQQQYCSNACRQRAYRKRVAARRTGGEPGIAAGGAAAAAPPTPVNLPAQLDRFIGRAQELRQLLAYGNAPVVTMIGAPGAGKSRLAIRFAELAASADAGLCWLDLDQVSASRPITLVVAEALGVPDSGGTVAELAASVGGRHHLLVLDNAEHVLDECARLVEPLVAACPQLRILVTSREALRIPGEVLLDVGPMPLPPAGVRDADHRIVLRAEAVQLFVERASASNPDFALSKANAATVAELCTELDGLPLAIEFAARRVGMFTVTDLLARLRRQENVLTVGSRTASVRHSSFRAAFDASHNTLDAAEQATFRRLSVLSGRFGLDLATAACQDPDCSEQDTVELLSGLLAKSLLVSEVDERGAGVFRQHNSVRRYAAQRLAEAGEQDGTWDRLVTWLSALLRRARTEVTTPCALLLRIHQLDDYLVTAADWTAKRNDPRNLLIVCALLRCHRGKATDARVEHLAGHALRMPDGELSDSALLLTELAATRLAAGNAAEAAELGEEAVLLARRSGAPTVFARALLELATCRREAGEFPEALANAESALIVAKEHDPFAGAARCLENLAATRLAAGELDLAETVVAEALAAARPADNWARVQALCAATDVALARGELDPAAANATEAIRRSPAEAELLLLPLSRLAVVEARRGDTHRALRLAETARALRAQHGFLEPPRLGGDPDGNGCVVASPPDAGELNVVRATAAKLSATAARAYALSEPWLHNGETGLAATHLSLRQRAIAALVAEGLTNSQIATRVGVSSRTVAAQLASLRSALHLQSRAQVAAWARTKLRYANYPSLARSSCLPVTSSLR